MLHNKKEKKNEKKTKLHHANELTEKNLNASLIRYQIEAMEKINARCKTGHLINLHSLLEEQSIEAIEKQFDDSIEVLLKAGFSNSPHLLAIKKFVYYGIPYLPNGLTVQVNNTYLLSTQSKPTEALFDLLENQSVPKVSIIINDNCAINIMFYYSLLKVLQQFINEQEGEELFNLVFGTLEGKMLIGRQLPHEVQRQSCALSSKIISPYFNIFSYFVEVIQGQILVGDIVNFENNSFYEKKNPWGNHGAYTLLCISNHKQGEYIGYHLGKRMNEEQIRQLAMDQYNHSPSWMRTESLKKITSTAGLGQMIWHKKIRQTQVPGFKNTSILRFNLARVLDLIQYPTHMLNRIKIYYEVEALAIVTARSEALIKAYKLLIEHLGENLFDYLPNTEISPKQMLIKQDNVLLLEMILVNLLQIANKKYLEKDFIAAIYDYKEILYISRVVYHYYERLSLRLEMQKALESIGKYCAYLDEALKNVGEIAEARKFHSEAKEIFEKLYGNDAQSQLDLLFKIAMPDLSHDQCLTKKKNSLKKQKIRLKKCFNMFDSTLVEKQKKEDDLILQAAAAHPLVRQDKEKFACHLDSAFFKQRYESEYLPECRFFTRKAQTNPRLSVKSMAANVAAKEQSRRLEALDLAKASKFRKG